ncbi:MAG: GNAT family N-acetyltransferase [Candidatus Heimdallarchaeota archaeon]
MTSQQKGKIILYDPSLAEKAAVMFNEFNKLWPGGFGGGVPYTAERVHDWLDKTSAIADLLAVDEDGELCGYCGLYPHWRDEKAAYISILGVIPKVKGQRFGKRLLLKALEIAEEKGITRVDLHTWSGNLDAVPLYKKVGLFWVPETAVYMQDYIPGIKQNPIAKEWFSKHPDWYANFDRELNQEPDKMVIDNMELFIYRFKEESDLLEVEIDRFGWGISGIFSKLGEQSIKIKTRLKNHNLFIGIPNEFKIEFQNGLAEDFECSLFVQKFPGLHWQGTLPKKVRVKKGEQKVVSCKFTLDKNANLYKGAEQACKSITTNISFGGYSLEFVTSGKIQSPIKLRTFEEEQFVVIPKGRESTISLDILNTTDLPIQGFVQIKEQKSSNQERKITVELKPNDVSGISFPYAFPATNPHNVNKIALIPFLQYGDTTIELPVFELPIFARVAGLAEYAAIQETERLYLLTDKLAVEVSLEGGNMKIYHGEKNGFSQLRLQAGPPYGLSRDTTLKFDYHLRRKRDGLLLKLTAKSRQIEGLLIEKFLELKAGLEEVHFWTKYTNLNAQKTILTSAKTGAFHHGISMNPYLMKVKGYAPLEGKIIETETFTNFLTTPMIPTDATLWHESWSASKMLAFNELTAWIWDPSTIEKVNLRKGMLNNLESKAVEISPGKSYQPIELWYSFGFTNLQQVRQRWSQLIGKASFPFEEILMGPEIIKDFDITLAKSQVLFAGKTNKLSLEVHFATNYPFQGELSLVAPSDWQAMFDTNSGLKRTISVPKAGFLKKVTLPIEVIIPANYSNIVENLQVLYKGEFEISFDNFVLVVPQGEVSVSQVVDQKKKLFKVQNGLLTFDVVAEEGGNLIRLTDNQGREYLIDSFPEIKAKYFLEHYLGGIQPQMFHPASEEIFTEPEKVRTVKCEKGVWKGTKSIFTIQNDKEFLTGLKCEIEYLTFPNSKIVLIRLKVENPTPRVVPFVGTFICDVGLQGTIEGTKVEVQAEKELWFHNAVKQQFTAFNPFGKALSRIFKDEQSIAFFVSEKTTGTVTIVDLGIMLIAWLNSLVHLEPFTEKIMEFAFVLDEPRDTAEKIRKAISQLSFK